MTEKKNGWKDCWKYTLRCLRDVERCVPGRLTSLLPVSLVVALTPYVTIWFSAQLVNELAGARRPEMLWRWTALTLGVSALLGLLKAGLMRWMNALNSMHNPMKERLFLRYQRGSAEHFSACSGSAGHSGCSRADDEPVHGQGNPGRDAVPE